MTPKEKYEQNVWYVLQAIKEKSFYLLENKMIEYLVYLHPSYHKEGTPTPMEETRIILQLIEDGVVKEKEPNQRIERQVGDHVLSPVIGYYLEIIQPKFDERYVSYEKRFGDKGVRQLAEPKEETAIKEIICVKPAAGSNRYIVVINSDYQNQISADKAKPSWNLLFRIAEKDLVEAEGHKSSLDYFNTNKGCRLYTQTGHRITKILRVEGGYILPVVKMNIMKTISLWSCHRVPYRVR